jgi:hypothetical protein
VVQVTAVAEFDLTKKKYKKKQLCCDDKRQGKSVAEIVK